MSLKYRKENIPLAKALRHNSTPQEKHLWYDYLSKYPIKFQRQKSIDNFIVDFYCHKAKLIIEIDGSQHYKPKNKEHDEFRTEILEGYDLTVIRFTNRQVDDNFCGVCKFIDFTVKALLTPEPPSGREVAFAKGSPTEKPLQMTEGESRRQ